MEFRHRPFPGRGCNLRKEIDAVFQRNTGVVALAPLTCGHVPAFTSLPAPPEKRHSLLRQQSHWGPQAGRCHQRWAAADGALCPPKASPPHPGWEAQTTVSPDPPPQTTSAPKLLFLNNRRAPGPSPGWCKGLRV